MSNLSFVRHTGDGKTRSFTLAVSGENIGYFRTSDIHGYVDDVEVPITINPSSPHIVTFTDAPKLGADILIRRQMPVKKTYADFARGNNFGHRQVNNTFVQQLYLTQEILDGFFPKGFYIKSDIDMGGHRLCNVGDAKLPNDAVTKYITDGLDHRINMLEQSVQGNTRFLPWQYNAVGEETELTPPYSFQSARLFINGVRQRAGAMGSYYINNKKIVLAEPLDEGDWVDVELGTEPEDISTNSPSQIQIWKDRGDIRGWGAIGKGLASVKEDTAAFKAALTLSENKSGRIYIPACSDFYAINEQLLLKASPMVTTIEGNGESSWVRFVGEHVESVIAISSRIDNLIFDNVFVDANGRANQTITAYNSSGVVFIPYLSTDSCRFIGAKDSGIKAVTYVTNMTKTIASGLNYGFNISTMEGLGQSTSISMDSCYAKNTKTGYYFGYATYCNLSACAADDVDLAYGFGHARGVTMSGCGAEKVKALIDVDGFRGFNVIGFHTQSCGSTDSSKPTPALISLGSGSGAVISGLNIDRSDSHYYSKKLEIRSTSYGFENVNILDDSITREETVYPEGSYNNRQFMIRFASDEINRKITKECATVEEFIAALKFAEYKTINATYTVKLTAALVGSSRIYCSIVKRGLSNMIIDLGGFTHKIDLGMSGVNCVIKNGTLNATSNSSYTRTLIADNCEISLSSVKGGTTYAIAGAFIDASNGSIINLTNSFAVGNYAAGGVYKCYNSDGTAEFNIVGQVELVRGLNLPVGSLVSVTGSGYNLAKQTTNNTYPNDDWYLA